MHSWRGFTLKGGFGAHGEGHGIMVVGLAADGTTTAGTTKAGATTAGGEAGGTVGATTAGRTTVGAIAQPGHGAEVMSPRMMNCFVLTT